MDDFNEDDRRHILSLSGGKDSTALALYMKDKVDDMEYVFCDTGREPPSLYEFIDELEEKLDMEIVRLHGGWHCPYCEKVARTQVDSDLPHTPDSIEEARDFFGSDPQAEECPNCGADIIERNFDYYMNRWSDDESGPYLPGGDSRWCTQYLKIRPFERYLRGDSYYMKDAEPAYVYVGMRDDEDRTGNYGDYDPVDYVYPFREGQPPVPDDAFDLEDVLGILDEAGIDLPDYYDWRSTGGCFMCPYQKLSDWLSLKEEHPELYEQAKREEELASQESFTWNATYSLEELEELGFEGIDEEDEETEQVWMGDACTICNK